MHAALEFKVDHALHTVESFSTLLEQETSALTASDFDTFRALHDRKVELAHEYQNAVLAFEEDIDILKTMDERLKGLLRAAHERFTAAAAANQTALKATEKVAGRIVGLIMDAARKTVSDTPNYSAAGHQGPSDKLPVHFKLNEEV